MAALKVLKLRAEDRKFLEARLDQIRDPKWHVPSIQRYPHVRPYRDAAGIWHNDETIPQFATNFPTRLHNFLFVFCEVLPEVGNTHLVRKVKVLRVEVPGAKVPGRADAEAIRRWPEKHGLHPKAPGANVPPGEHVLNLHKGQTQYNSASESPLGSPMNAHPAFAEEGRPVLIDIAKATRAGASVVSTSDLVRDLEKIANSTGAAEYASDVKARARRSIQAVRDVEHEALVAHSVPAKAIRPVSRQHQLFIKKAENVVAKNFPDQSGLESGARPNVNATIEELRALEGQYAKARALGGIAKVVGWFGLALTTADLIASGVEWAQTGSPVPFEETAIRQGLGWAGGWAGFEMGFGGGAMLGLGTGPGALLTGLAGGTLFSLLGEDAAQQIIDLWSPD